MDKKKQELKAYATQQIQVVCAALVLILANAQPASANWRVAPKIGVGVEYDSNARLQSSALSESVEGFGVSGELGFVYKTPLTELEITPRLRAKRYDSDSALDSNDHFLDINYKYQRQLASFRFRANYSRESVRTAERIPVDFEIEDPIEIPNDDSARVLDTGKRDRILLAPEFSYRFTERFFTKARLTFLDASYDNSVSASLTDFRDTSFTGELGYNWSPRDTLSLAAYTREYEVDAGGPDISGNGIVAGYQRKLSRRTTIDITLGGDSTELPNGSDESNLVGRASIVHRLETIGIIAAIQRSVSGSGGGELSVRNTVSLNVSRDVTEKLTISGGARLYRTKGLDDSAVSLDERDYLQFRALARLYLSRTVSVELNYRYTQVDREALGTDADANRVDLWIHWHPGRPAK